MWYFGENDSWNLLVTTIECDPVGDSSWYDTRGSCGLKPQSLVTDVFYPCFCPAFKSFIYTTFHLFCCNNNKIHKQKNTQAACVTSSWYNTRVSCGGNHIHLQLLAFQSSICSLALLCFDFIDHICCLEEKSETWCSNKQRLKCFCFHSQESSIIYRELEVQAYEASRGSQGFE